MNSHRRGPPAANILVGLFVALAGPMVPSLAQAEAWAVVSVDACQEGGVERAEQFRRALSERVGKDLISQEETLHRLGRAPDRSLEEVDRLLQGARLEFYQQALDRAERVLLQARDDLNGMPPSPQTWNELREVLVMLSWVERNSNKTDEMEKALSQILRVERDYVPSPTLYPPAIRQVAGSVKKKLGSMTSVTLNVHSQPEEDLPVYVDGRPMGRTPLRVELPEGAYRVEVGFGSGRGLPRQVELHEATTLQFRADFDGAVWTQPGPCMTLPAQRKERLDGLVHLARVLGVDRIAGVFSSEPTHGEHYLHATVVETQTGQEAREAKVKWAGPSDRAALTDLVDFVATGQVGRQVLTDTPKPDLRPAAATTSSTPASTSKPATATTASASASTSAAASGTSAGELKQPTPASTETSFDGRRIGAYVAGGVAAVALAASIVGFVEAQKTQNDLNKLQGPGGVYPAGSQSQVKQLSNQLGNQQTLAYVGLGVCAAGVATGVGLFVWSSFDPQVPSTSGNKE